MHKKAKKTSYGLIITSVLLLGGMFAGPVAAQQPTPVPHFCSMKLKWDTGIWTQTVQSRTCGAIETQTQLVVTWPSCQPGPNCTPTPVFKTRSRRLNLPNINFARSFGTNPSGCVLNPASTAWTAWTTCRSGAPPEFLTLESLWVQLL